jgi:B9 domain-containing protein 1
LDSYFGKLIIIFTFIICTSLQQGIEEGITQQSQKGLVLSDDSHSYPRNVWNFPVEIAFRSTNPFGWPQIVLSVYGPDALGRDIVRGYGAIHLPRTVGNHTLYIPMFVPLASSPLNALLSSLAGKAPVSLYKYHQIRIA